jgi:hypothetical protein
MELNLLTAHIQYCLLNESGLSEDKIIEMKSNNDFELIILPLIEECALQLKINMPENQQIDSNKNLLISKF